MSQFIVLIQSMPTIASLTETKAAQASVAEGLPFADVLQGAIENLNTASTNSQQSMQTLAVGGNDDLHSGAIDVLKSSTATSFTTGVVSSVVRAYNELLRMSI